jgi:hypothetical protein
MAEQVPVAGLGDDICASALASPNTDSLLNESVKATGGHREGPPDTVSGAGVVVAGPLPASDAMAD